MDKDRHWQESRSIFIIHFLVNIHFDNAPTAILVLCLQMFNRLSKEFMWPLQSITTKSSGDRHSPNQQGPGPPLTLTLNLHPPQIINTHLLFTIFCTTTACYSYLAHLKYSANCKLLHVPAYSSFHFKNILYIYLFISSITWFLFFFWLRGRGYEGLILRQQKLMNHLFHSCS